MPHCRKYFSLRTSICHIVVMKKKPVVDKASSQKLGAAFVYRTVFYILEVPLLLLNVKLFYLI